MKAGKQPAYFSTTERTVLGAGLAAAQSSGPGASSEDPMTREQAARLKELAEQALEPESFDPMLTAAEAARRIAALEVKVRNMDGPPHTV
jgi:hypothetical protein